VAKTFGKGTIFGKEVQQGVGARLLEWANQLLFTAYETTPGLDNDGDGNPDWYVPVIDPTTGQPRVKFDPSIAGTPGCTASDNSKCTCSSNKSCLALQKYVEVPFFMRQAITAYGLGNPEMKGIWD
jgi:hypothetical protein